MKKVKRAGVLVHNAFQLSRLIPGRTACTTAARMIRYGAKTIPEGGYFSIPETTIVTGVKSPLKAIFKQTGAKSDSRGRLKAQPANCGIHHPAL